MGAKEESPHHHQRKRVLLIVMEDDEHGYLLYKISLKALFYTASATVHAQPRGVRRLPAPMARFDKLPDKPELIDFALAAGGSTLIGVSNLRRTLLHDTASGASSAGPELQHDKPGGTFVLPLLGGMLALRRRGGLAGELPFAEFLPAVGGGEWRALPDPPPEFCSLTRSMPVCNVTACVAAGAHVWVSAAGRGTYSLEGAAWRKEGDWELPFHGRGLFVPELGAGLCFGLCPLTGNLCACDINQSPPAVRYTWHDTTPRLPEGRDARYLDGSLAYLGHGKFCIAWTIGIPHRVSLIIRRRAVYLTGVKVSNTSGGRLRMIQHKLLSLPRRCWSVRSTGCSCRTRGYRLGRGIVAEEGAAAVQEDTGWHAAAGGLPSTPFLDGSFNTLPRGLFGDISGV